MNLHKLLWTLGSLSLFSLASCSDDEGSEDVSKLATFSPIELSRSEQVVADGQLTFMLDLLREMDKINVDRKNVAVSPLGAEMVTAMLANALEPEAQQNLLDALKLTVNDIEGANSFNKLMLEKLPVADESARLGLANSLWFNSEIVQPSASYSEILASCYSATTHALDFSDENATLSAINAWVESNTGGTFPNTFKTIDPYVAAIWLNTIDFKGVWSDRFYKESTRQDFFTKEDGVKVKTDFMSGLVAAIPFSNGPISGFTQPYGNSAFCFSAIMTPPDLTVTDLLDDFPLELLERMKNNADIGFAAAEYEKSHIYIPRFSFQIETDLIEVMKNLGVRSVFDGCAMPGLLSEDATRIEDFKQNISLDVDEEGTEIKVVSKPIAGPSSPGDFFNMTRPFIFFVWERSTAAVLLAGIFMEP